jgi:hypothetical protein
VTWSVVDSRNIFIIFSEPGHGSITVFEKFRPCDKSGGRMPPRQPPRWRRYDFSQNLSSFLLLVYINREVIYIYHLRRLPLITMDLELINRITDILTFLQLRTRNANSLHLFDINTRAEFFYRDLLNLVHGWKLKNANTARMNAAYIDLIDDVSDEKIAIQVTSQNDSGKIWKTVEGFFKDIDNKQFKLKILLISKEAKEYRADFSREGEFEFDAETDIIDISKLLTDISDKDIDSLKEIKTFLEKYVNFTEQPPPSSKFYPNNFIPDLKYFVGREELLANLGSTLKTHHKASIHDISGLGKTFTCYKYAFDHQDNYKRVMTSEIVFYNT